MNLHRFLFVLALAGSTAAAAPRPAVACGRVASAPRTLAVAAVRAHYEALRSRTPAALAAVWSADGAVNTNPGGCCSPTGTPFIAWSAAVTRTDTLRAYELQRVSFGYGVFTVLVRATYDSGVRTEVLAVMEREGAWRIVRLSVQRAGAPA